MKGEYHVYANWAGVPVEVQCPGIKKCGYCQAMKRDPYSRGNLFRLIRRLAKLAPKSATAKYAIKLVNYELEK